MALKNKEYKKAALTVKRYLLYKMSGNGNPFDTFEQFMEHSDLYGFKNHFFFMACNKGELGYTYDLTEEFVQNKILLIEHNLLG